MDTHTIRGFDPDTTESLELAIQKSDEFISVKESTGDDTYREALIEYSNGTLCVRLYPGDSDTPVIVRLPETGGVEIDRHDYDVSVTPEIEMLATLEGITK